MMNRLQELTVIGFVVGLGLNVTPATAMSSLLGQQGICGNAPKQRTINLTAIEKTIDIGQGLTTHVWTFNGTVPGPAIEVCEGDKVRVVMKNDGTTAHGVDSHAFRITAERFGPVETGKTLVFEKVVETPGVFMYHCAAGAVTDEHIKMGMYGVMIVYPRKLKLRPALEFVLTEAGIYGEPDNNGLISPSSERMAENRPFLVVFNGQSTHEPVKIRPGQLIRVYFVHVGPGGSAFHVIGTILDRAYEGGNPRNVLHDIQTYNVPAGSGSMFEFTLPEAGSFVLVDHNLLSQVPNGLAIPFVAK